MSEISEAAKARADELAQAVRGDWMATGPNYREAFTRFIQDVSDAAKKVSVEFFEGDGPDGFTQFMLPEPDPLLEALTDAYKATSRLTDNKAGRAKFTAALRSELARRNLKIVAADQ